MVGCRAGGRRSDEHRIPPARWESPAGKEFLEEPKLSHIVFCQADEGCEEDAQAKGKEQ